ncbi:MAG TPA: serine/threonine-protein kinase [Gemmataceae bacterium]|nr:serine/threonine-protein kinase [Gemmataceae bacterium]
MPPNSAAADDSRSVLRHACAELEQRLRAGEDCHAEQLLAAHPELASDPDRALELIQVEWLARQALGRSGPPEEWFARFPQWADSLRRWLDQDGPLPGTTADSERTVPSSHPPPRRPKVPLPEQRLDDLEIRGEIGHGGMGIVYRAWDPALRREVALKKIRAGTLATPDQVSRFYREARAAAQLQHPNILPIHGMGLHHGEHCFTMPLLTGGSLADHANRFSASLRAAVVLVEKVARAIQAAHEKGIIHRDLTPANIFMDERGEPLVGDFGLARFSDTGTDVTIPGQVLGTPSYMAPEQAAGQVWKVGPGSDIYSVGVILYELVTGRRPFEGKKSEEVLRQVLTESPPRPRELRPTLDRGLEAILLRCLEREPTRRYATAGALADDLGRWLRGRPVRALRLPWFAPPWRAGRGHYATVAVLVLVLTALVVLLPGSSSSSSSTTTQPKSDATGEGLAELQRELAAGRRVALLGPDGKLRWHRFLTEKRRLPLRAGRGDPLRLEAWNLTLMALLPTPGMAAYRFEAEVLHEQSNEGRAGIFFAARESNAGHGEFSLCTLAYASHGMYAGEWRFWRQRFAETGTVPHGLNLHSSPLLSDRPFALRPNLWLPVLGASTVNLLASPFGQGPILTASGLFPGRTLPDNRYHKLAIEVRPGDIRVFWENDPMRGISCAALEQRTTRPLKPKLPEFPNLGPPPPFDIQGSLGLYVDSGIAWFRNVYLTPLADK